MYISKSFHLYSIAEIITLFSSFPSVLRERGHFGNVTVFWQLFANDSVTLLEENQEFINTSGSITFTTGEETKPIVLQAISDTLPEFNEFFILKLVNISGKFQIKGKICQTLRLNSPGNTF